MTDETNQSNEDVGKDDDLLKDAPSELELLKNRATAMGISYHPSIGLDALKAKVNAKMADQPDPEAAASKIPAPSIIAGGKAGDEVQDETPDVEEEVEVAEETPVQRRARKKREANELVRIRVQCMNPTKAEWEGEIFTAGNGVVGTFSKYVPFNSDEGWHVPRIIYNMMKARMCQVFQTETDHRGNKVRKGKLKREFSIEVLPPLTIEELTALAHRQAATKAVD